MCVCVCATIDNMQEYYSYLVASCVFFLLSSVTGNMFYWFSEQWNFFTPIFRDMNEHALPTCRRSNLIQYIRGGRIPLIYKKKNNLGMKYRLCICRNDIYKCIRFCSRLFVYLLPVHSVNVIKILFFFSSDHRIQRT